MTRAVSPPTRRGVRFVVTQRRCGSEPQRTP
jgi:hypothetical protein